MHTSKNTQNWGLWRCRCLCWCKNNNPATRDLFCLESLVWLLDNIVLFTQCLNIIANGDVIALPMWKMCCNVNELPKLAQWLNDYVNKKRILCRMQCNCILCYWLSKSSEAHTRPHARESVMLNRCVWRTCSIFLLIGRSREDWARTFTLQAECFNQPADLPSRSWINLSLTVC